MSPYLIIIRSKSTDLWPSAFRSSPTLPRSYRILAMANAVLQYTDSRADRGDDKEEEMDTNRNDGNEEGEELRS